MANQILRMGRIGYLNVLPIYYPLEAGFVEHEFELVAAPPAVLNSMMARGELHISSASCFEYAKNPQKYYIVDDLSIGSRGPVMSVLLLSSCPIEELEHSTIQISAETATSVALLKLLLAQKYNINVEYQTGIITPLLNSDNPPKAFLAIGDEALRLRNHANYPYKIDLAEAWQKWTGLPFIFGLWVVSRQAADAKLFTKDPGQLLRDARDYSMQHMDTILDLTKYGCPLSREELEIYYRDGLLYTLKNDELEGLKVFYDKLAQAQMIDKVPNLDFYRF